MPLLYQIYLYRFYDNVEKKSLYSTGGLLIDDDLKEVTVDGEPVRLTPIEYNILTPTVVAAIRCARTIRTPFVIFDLYHFDFILAPF